MKTLGSSSDVGGALHQALKEFGLERKINEHSLIANWGALVEPAIANNTKPLRFRDGTLYVEVESAAWRHELTTRKSGLIARINAKLGSEIILNIVFR